MKNYILCRGDSYSMIATSTVVYVDKTMMPTILKNYEAQLSREAAKFEFLPPNLSSVASDNESNISLYGSAEPPRESAVIIVTRYEKGRRRRTSDVYRHKVFEWTLNGRLAKLALKKPTNGDDHMIQGNPLQRVQYTILPI